MAATPTPTTHGSTDRDEDSTRSNSRPRLVVKHLEVPFLLAVPATQRLDVAQTVDPVGSDVKVLLRGHHPPNLIPKAERDRLGGQASPPRWTASSPSCSSPPWASPPSR